jgi:hypothetical protein
MTARPGLRWAGGELARAAAASGYALVAAEVVAAVAPGVWRVFGHRLPQPVEVVLEHVRHGQLLVLVALLGIAIAVPVRALLALRRGAAPVRRWIALGGGAVALEGLAAWNGVGRARSAVVRELAHPTDLTFDHVAFERLADDACTIALAGAGLALAAALWGALGVAWAGRTRRPTVAVAVTAGAVVMGVAALGAVRAAATFLGTPDGCCGGEPCRYRWYEFFGEALGPLASTRTDLLLVALVGSVAILAMARRDRAAPPPSRRTLGVCAGVFALGLLAFASTRAAAHDVQNPPEWWERFGKLGLEAAQVAKLPAAGRCEHSVSYQMVVRWDPEGGFWLDGERVGGDEALREAVFAKVRLWKQVQPGRHYPGPQVAIDADAPLARVGVLMDIVRAAGLPGIEALEALPARATPSRALGDVPYDPRLCRVLIGAERRLPSEGTWGELVHASEP